MPWFVPWYVNERTSWVYAFVDAKSATNDPVLPLTKIIDFSCSKIFASAFWKNAGALSVLSHRAIQCVILTPLVKCAQNNHRMTHNIATQWRMFDKSQLRQSDDEFEIFKEKSNTVPLHPLRSLCIPQQLMKSLSIPLLTLEIMIATTGTVQLAADCTRVEHRLPLSRQSPPNHNICKHTNQTKLSTFL